MNVLHHSRKTEYRSPYGAVALGDSVKLSLDVWEGDGFEAFCRLWIDGEGETLLPMERCKCGDHLRFTITLQPDHCALIWYSFLLRRGEEVRYYGAKEGTTGGEGQLYSHEPPSFQLTIYRPRAVPTWYKNAIVYQIFPDRFASDDSWPERSKAIFSTPRKGIQRAAIEDWHMPPRYEKNEAGRVVRWDFYGGTLRGIREKIPYLAELGITALYLNPIFEACSNHRYDTADYTKIDPLLGTEEDFRTLCDSAHALGIHIILDGVFNHTGCDSIYFNKFGNYPSCGAYESEDSPYRPWFRFKDDGSYSCWWGVDDLPDLEENDPAYRRFICDGEDSIVRRWLRAGADGWRLDVADELPDDFIAEIKSAALAQSEDSLVIGEVWEDASNKISYGQLRRYFLGDELDGVMNYPLRDGLLGFLRGTMSGDAFSEALESLRENYPPEAFAASLNLLGSHDRPRLLTVLGDAPEESSLTEAQRAEYRLSEYQRSYAKSRLWLLAVVQMLLPGVPCIYYGDEAGLEGYGDPFNRGTYPWGREDADTMLIYKNAIALRKAVPFAVDGALELHTLAQPDLFAFSRSSREERIVVAINRSRTETHTLSLPAAQKRAVELTGGRAFSLADGILSCSMPPLSAVVIHLTDADLAKPLSRGAGVLCHITSLPNEGKRGTLGPCAERFIDFLAAGSQRYWQLLPLQPTDHQGSPYAGRSAFAGNIALLDEDEAALRARFASFTPDEKYAAFCRENDFWLTPYALFTAISAKFGSSEWQNWPEPYRTYSAALAEREELTEGVAYHKFCQYVFEQRMGEVKAYAAAKGISLLGDAPIYVSEHSADVWAHRELFLLDEDGRKTQVAGVPPDYFSADGQLWGNPLYNWAVMEQDGFSWWIARLKRAFSLYDYVRLDHFRGFAACWSIPAGKSAKEGRWVSVPGQKLFEAAHRALGPLPIVAEDLGTITAEARLLLNQCGFPGMDIVQFYDTDPRADYAPAADRLSYTGTHDNETLLGWCEGRYGAEEAEAAAAELMQSVYNSDAIAAIVPLQDILKLDNSARMNTPGTTIGNWSWQAPADALQPAIAEELKILTEQSKRS